MTAIALRPATSANSEFCFQLHKAAMCDYITADGTDIGMIDIEHRAAETYLSRIEIHPSYQGRGIGTGLIRALIEEAAQHGQDLVLDVLTVNHRAQALYQRLGMTEIARHGEGNIKITMRFSPPHR